MNALRSLFARIGAINARYRTPRIGMSGPVRISLMVLRVYLLALVALMVYRFALIVAGG
jgi:hypothetical protein